MKNICLTLMLCASALMISPRAVRNIEQAEPEIISVEEVEIVSESVVCSPDRHVTVEEETETAVNKTENAVDETSVEELAKCYSYLDLIACAQMLYGEYRNGDAYGQMRCVWTACNRVDAGIASTVYEAITMPNQFIGYSSDNPVTEELLEVARYVLDRWSEERSGEIIERELPKDYLWFSGDGFVNIFRNTYEFTESTKYIF